MPPGAHGVDIGSWVQNARVLTRAGEIIERDRDAVAVSYRQREQKASQLLRLALLLLCYLTCSQSPPF